MAVITAAGHLQLYGIEPKAPRALLLRDLLGPTGAKARYVTLSSGSTPRVCATWQISYPTRTLLCYDWPSARGYQVATEGADLTDAVGLSVSGRALAWTAERKGENRPALYVQRAPGGPASRVPAETSPSGGYEPALEVGDVAWEGEDRVLISYGYDSDVNGAIGVVPVGTPPNTGWKDAPVIGLTDQRWPVVQGLASSTEDSHALAIVWDAGSSMQAVQLDLTNKRIASVVAFPATGRRMTSVSGGPGGVLYRTESDQDRRTYWRAPGRPYGSPLTGLPADAWSVVAQP